MNIEQFKVYQDKMNIKEGKEWDKTEGKSIPKVF